MDSPKPLESPWFLYVILCSDRSLYTGITTDIERRFSEHARGRGARFFRGRQPLRVVYRETHNDRASASRREYQIKQLSRQQKLALVADGSGEG
ncbi:GIY-YIG nuclease family protein [Aestuariirhabdus litorea]|uniref:GIY-YIG nuclease family protein n=1 Tax=Aestuariirhabdus litorea TaxID=2528527 RepID=A0A3P3VM67_9GAMM|nr:GIY-YIG nuclease family protein [Aestuariirhabdus litorea]RRJ83861.1 GIY-YIG nuclease family protein [Aestuariirhabdus litorea]RWW97084.1 GIY-YIG nuclease family protein [Endozoicomonadaceae bacterium GTF-13]